jgi:hypothetical protein
LRLCGFLATNALYGIAGLAHRVDESAPHICQQADVFLRLLEPLFLFLAEQFHSLGGRLGLVALFNQLLHMLEL